MTAEGPSPADPPPASSSSPWAHRVASIDALRGFVMFTMIFVNDLAGAPREIVPWWMRHFPANGNGMTFVDLVFPAFLFIVGMSIPLSLGGRLERGAAPGKVILHVLTRTLLLLAIGILMVNETPDSTKLGWSGALWTTLMYLSAILAFASLVPNTAPTGQATRSYRTGSIILRATGLAGLVVLAFVFVGPDGHRIITLRPFSIHTSWYGILGLIGWAYLVGAISFMLFRTRRTALLACVVLLMCIYPAAWNGAFDNFWLNHFVGIGGTLGSQASITVSGLLLASVLMTPDTATFGRRTRFTFLFVAGCAAAALLLHGLYGINKNAATPSWCLWACAITAALWYGFYLVCDVRPLGAALKPLTFVGANVFLAYLLSEMLPSFIELLGWGSWYDHLAGPSLPNAIGRSAGCALFVLLITALLNRGGFKLKL